MKARLLKSETFSYYLWNQKLGIAFSSDGKITSQRCHRALDIKKGAGGAVLGHELVWCNTWLSPQTVMKGLHLNTVSSTTSNMYNNVAAVRRLQGEKIHNEM